MQKSFYLASVADFLKANTHALLGQMAERLAQAHGAAENSQLEAWRRQTEILQTALQTAMPVTADWQIICEAALLRLGRRIDAVILAHDICLVIEFKVGEKRYDAAAIAQAEDYALALKDFHQVAQSMKIVPIVCAEGAPDIPSHAPVFLEGVSQPLKANAANLANVIRLAVGAASGPTVTASAFDQGAYRPTPTIIEAARNIYAGHKVADIGRGDAAAAALDQATEELLSLILQAREQKQHLICFVTGTPGAGKTLLGLNVALRSRVAGGDLPPATLLSGNPPLVHVLQEALAHDAKHRDGGTIDQARRGTQSAIQGLLGFLKEHDQGRAPPPEHVLVFDEAQRAWDADVGLRLLGRQRSEPALFLDIMAQKDWACVICLVGPGQEINRGEGGLSLWGEAIAEANAKGKAWQVCAAPQAIWGGEDVGVTGLYAAVGDVFEVTPKPTLHLQSAMRSYRNPDQVRWVAHLLSSDIEKAAQLATHLERPPAYVVRDLDAVKAYLQTHRRGGRSVGLLLSSGGVRLQAEGLLPSPRSNELDAIGHWFLRPRDDYRSGSALEVPLSEFACQGLEIDHAGVCWGGDLIWSDDRWVPRAMRAPRWQIVNQSERQQFRLNGYRVLLTRSRAGMVIYVPRGEAEDPTRQPAELDAVADVLIRAGCQPLDPS